MKVIMKSIITASLLLATLTVSAQSKQDIDEQMSHAMSFAIDHGVEVTKSLGQERDIQQPGRPLKWRCDIYSFTLPKKERYLLDEMVSAFEACGHDNPLCYGINSMSESKSGDRVGHHINLMIGDDPQRYVTIGKDYSNFINANILDDADTTKTHRYAYALEWRDADKGNTDVRYVVTYAKIPSGTTNQTWPFLNLGQASVKDSGPILFKGDARIQWNGKDYPVMSLDSLLRDAEKRATEARQQYDALRRTTSHKFQTDSCLVLWTDTLNHDADPVTDVVKRLHQGRAVTAADLLCNDNILLVFSQLKQQFLAGENTEFNAISVYSLCKRAREYGFFTDPDAKGELEQLKRDVAMMKSRSADETLRNYLQMALAELEKIKE